MFMTYKNMKHLQLKISPNGINITFYTYEEFIIPFDPNRIGNFCRCNRQKKLINKTFVKGELHRN